MNGNPAGPEGQVLDWADESSLASHDPPRPLEADSPAAVIDPRYPYPSAAVDQVVVDWQLPAESSR
jgi:hypothetical protein